MQPTTGHGPNYQLVQGRHGRFLCNRNDDYIARSLALYGEWSEAEVQLYGQIVRAGDTVVEAGANLGSHTVPLSKLVGEAGQVLAFEPARLTHQLLCTNLALNECFNVQAFQRAVGRRGCALRFPKLDPKEKGNPGGASFRIVPQLSPEQTEPVTMCCLDELALTRLDFLKADVEGHETAVLAGARDTLARLRPAVYLELDCTTGHSAGNRDELLDIFEPMGYAVYYYFTPMYASDNWRGNADDVFKAASLDVLCLPTERFEVSGLSRAERADEALTITTTATGQYSVLYCVHPWNTAQVRRV